MAIKDSQGGASFLEWDAPLKLREPEAIRRCRHELSDEICFWQFLQYLFAKQWQALKAYANGKGISIIGDIPIYVALDSADTWSHPELFQLSEGCVPKAVAGVPPDAFSATGQLWGNPLYDWEKLRGQRRMLREARPDCVIGCGGYVSGPVVRCAAKMGIHTALHEQNAFPGVTNKLLAPDVDIVFAAVPAAVEKLGAPQKTIVVGNPVRPEVFTQAKNRDAIRAQLGAGDRTVILSFGGSLGARRVNEVVGDLCAWEQQEHKSVLHLHATGQYGVQLFKDLEQQKGFAEGDSLVVKEYINNMPELLAAADLVISRAGALTLAELEAVGRAAVLIPSPNVAENHQYYNAMELQKAGAAVVIEEKDLTGEKLVQTVSEMLTQPGKLAEMGRNARSLSVDDSLDRIAAALLELVKKA